MKNKSYRFYGIIFVVLALIAIIFSGIRPMLFPSQEVDFNRDFGFGPIIPAVILRQEIPMKKEYIEGVEVIMGNSRNMAGIENVMLLTDAGNNILFTKKFDSREISGTNFFRFNFEKNIRIGRGNKCYICLYSTNADQNQNVSLVINSHAHLGSLSYTPVNNNDVINALGGKWSFFNGSMVVKTFETNTELFSGLHLILYFLAFLFGAVIFFFRRSGAG